MLLVAAAALRRLAVRPRARARSHCRFRNRGTEMFSKYVMKWMNDSTSVFAQEVDGSGTEGMLCPRSSKRLLSNHLEL